MSTVELSQSDRLRLYEKLSSSEEFKAEEYIPEVREYEENTIAFPPQLARAVSEYGTIGKVLGKGVYGVVAEIVPKKPEDRLALKVIFNDRENWALEKKYAHKIRHTHSLTWLAEGKLTVDGKTVDWFIYPRADMSADALLQDFNEKKTSSEERWRVAKSMVWQLLRVVEKLHDKGVVHNDIFLRNILVNRPKHEGEKYTFFLNDYGAVRSHEELIESFHPPHQEDADFLLNAAAYLARGKYNDLFHVRQVVEGLPPWLERCRGILKSLPKGARVPFERLKQAIRSSKEEDAPMADNEANLAKLKEAIDRVDQERSIINMALASASREFPAWGTLTLTTKQFMLESIRQGAASIAEAHAGICIILYILEDEEQGGEPWVSFMPIHRTNIAQRGASIALNQMMSNPNAILAAIRQCK